MKNNFLTALLVTSLTAYATNPVYAEALPKIDPNLNIHMPDAVYTTPSGEVLRLKADFSYLGISERGTFLWEVKPDGYTILSNNTSAPPEEICSASPLAKGEARTLHNINNGVDYIIDCNYVVNGDLVIDPDVTIQFGTDSGMSVFGSIQAIGTSEQPIIFTGEDKNAGSWRGILIDSNDSKNTLQYTQIDYAGGGAFGSNGDLGAVIAYGSRLKMTDTTIHHSAAYGLNASYGEANLTLKDNVITTSQAPMILNGAYPTTISGGTYTGNETDAIFVNSDQITGQHNWTNLGIPYRIANRIVVIAGGELTIQPGVTLEFEDDGELSVFEGASGSAPSLIAVGTEQNPITFTGVNKVLGAWKGIYFDTPSPLNEIGFANISYASNSRREGAVYTWAASVANVHDVSFESIQNCAFDPGTTNPNPNLSISNITYNNVGDEICGD